MLPRKRDGRVGNDAMDKITKTLLDDFSDAEAFEGMSESDAFARFANFSVVSREYSDTFTVEDVTSDGENDTGLDGVAIIVNGSLVTEKEDIKELVDTNGYLDATFVFVQSKTSANFNGAEMSSFAFGVQDFFADKPKLPRNEAIKRMAEVQSTIYSTVAAMTRRRPDLRLYYVTTGKWQDDMALRGRVETATSDLKETGLFNEVRFNPVDAEQLQNFYRATKSKASAEFKFAKRLTLPEMGNVKEAYLGILPAKEFIQLIQDASGNIRKSLFYDNVRDFQDYNEVNKDIRATLQSADKERFVLLNNGVTILAKTMRTVGDNFHVEDFQVVNGCQTSHVLFDNRASITDAIFVPLKVIVTADEGVTSAIITATNRQTAVKEDQLYALSGFQKQLETYYNTFKDSQQLFYERRSRQYASVPEIKIKKVRIVPIQLQMRAFAAMFLDDAHRGHYPASLRQFVGSKIFHKNHRLEPYYTSAFAHYKLESLFRNGSLDSRYKPARYHLLMVARHQVGEGHMPALQANVMQKYCEGLLTHLWDDAAALAMFQDAIQLIDAVVDTRALNRDLAKTQPFTEEILVRLRAA